MATDKERMSNITRAQVRKLFTYDPATGHLTWRDCNMPQYNGTRAGCSAKGARVVTIHSKGFSERRVIWLWMKGQWPAGRLAARDGDSSNNAWENLYEIK